MMLRFDPARTYTACARAHGHEVKSQKKYGSRRNITKELPGSRPGSLLKKIKELGGYRGIVHLGSCSLKVVVVVPISKRR